MSEKENKNCECGWDNGCKCESKNYSCEPNEFKKDCCDHKSDNFTANTIYDPYRATCPFRLPCGICEKTNRQCTRYFDWSKAYEPYCGPDGGKYTYTVDTSTNKFDLNKYNTTTSITSDINTEYFTSLNKTEE